MQLRRPVPLHIASLYSLEKLIEWKLTSLGLADSEEVSLYSLEKLIEWKRGGLISTKEVLMIPTALSTR